MLTILFFALSKLEILSSIPIISLFNLIRKSVISHDEAIFSSITVFLSNVDIFSGFDNNHFKLSGVFLLFSSANIKSLILLSIIFFNLLNFLTSSCQTLIAQLISSCFAFHTNLFTPSHNQEKALNKSHFFNIFAIIQIAIFVFCSSVKLYCFSKGFNFSIILEVIPTFNSSICSDLVQIVIVSKL
jgi:hypothetical protein